MNIDLLPVSAIPPDNLGRSPAETGDVQTLTLALALGTSTRSVAKAMAGSAKRGKLVLAPPGTERAAILPSDAVALTITF